MPIDEVDLQTKARVFVLKWKAGSDTNGPPDEIIERKEEGFPDLPIPEVVEAALKLKEQQDAAT